MTISELQNMIGRWADKVFPDRTVHTSLSKLVLEEIPEFLTAKADDAGEYADVLIMVLDVAYQKGIDVEAAVLTKHKRNTERAWRRTESGVYRHVPELRSESPTPKPCVGEAGYCDACSYEKGAPVYHTEVDARARVPKSTSGTLLSSPITYEEEPPLRGCQTPPDVCAPYVGTEPCELCADREP